MLKTTFWKVTGIQICGFTGGNRKSWGWPIRANCHVKIFKNLLKNGKDLWVHMR
jgi:hypothetical protein